ncbi:O-antigen ligase family protein [Paraflavisolibacter sp. H34]|uniref:O-antigen ligase family protein n=1 Tax=Huijunlia imazamoxiresistens TaxID=3127457 RepID=UPI00301B1806
MENKAPFPPKAWYRNLELVYSIFGIGLVVGLIFWPLLDSLFSIGLAAYWLLFARKNFSTPRARYVLLFCLLYVMVLVGVLYSANMKEALFKLQLKSAFLVFPLVFGTTEGLSAGVFRRIFGAFIGATLLGCLFCLASGLYVWVTTGSVHQLYGYELVVVKDMHPFVLGLCGLLSLLYLLVRHLERFRQEGRLSVPAAEMAAAAFLFLFLLLLGNRNTLIFLGGVLLFFGFRLIPRIGTRLLFLGSFVLVVTAAVLFNPSFRRQWYDLVDFSKENTIQLDQDASLGRGWGGKAIRLTIWKCSMDVLEQHWAAGVGTGDLQDTLQRAYEKRKFYFASRYNSYNAHNQYLEEFLTRGIAGLLVFLACILWPLLVGIREKDTLYTLYLLCFAFFCITESMLELHKGVMWYSFFNALLFFRNSKALI